MGRNSGGLTLGILAFANKVCGIERQTYWFLGPTIEPGCKRNVTYGSSASLVSSVCSSLLLAVASPVLGLGTSLVVAAVCLALFCMGRIEAGRPDPDGPRAGA